MIFFGGGLSGAPARRSVTVAVGAGVAPQTWIMTGTVEVAMPAVA